MKGTEYKMTSVIATCACNRSQCSRGYNQHRIRSTESTIGGYNQRVSDSRKDRQKNNNN